MDGASGDARVADASPDATVDAAEDAAPDAAVDAAPSVAPACMTSPTMLLDTGTLQISNIALAGNVLYVGEYQQGTNANAQVVAIDLTTESEAAAPLPTTGGSTVWSANGDVYVSDPVGGTIWQLHPGAAPVALVTGRPRPGAVTADDTYVYWSERNAVSGMPDVIQRRAIAGGAVELVMPACDSASDLIVVDAELYCATYGGNLLHHAKDGSGATAGIANINSYPISSTIHDGNNLFFVNLYPNPQLWRAPLPNGPAMLVQQQSQISRYTGLAATTDYFYTVDQGVGIRRINRTNLATQVIYSAVGTSNDPVLWNSQLYFEAANPNLGGQRYVMHCVD